MQAQIDIEQLVSKCRQGDTDALGRLYSLYSQRMMRIVCRYVNEWDVAQDILHDGFLVVFSQIGTLKDSSKLEYWMAVIMRNLALQYLRSVEVESLLSEMGEEGDFDIPEEIPLEEILKMIERLPEGYRNVFKLAVLEGKTHIEIGEMLGISPHSSSSQLFRAKLQLRKMITDYKLRAGMMVVLLAIVTMVALWWLHQKGTPVDMAIDHVGGAQTAAVAEKVDSENENSIDGREELFAAKNVLKSLLAEVRQQDAVVVVDSVSHIVEAEKADTNMSAKTPDKEAVVQDTAQLNGQLTATDIKSYPNHKQGDYTFAQSSPGRSWNLSVGGDGLMLGQIPIGNGYTDRGYGLAAPPGDTPVHNYDTIYTSSLPITLSMRVQKRIAPKLALEIGVQYTRMSTEMKLVNNTSLMSDTKKISEHYLGVPLHLRYDMVQRKRFVLYVLGGGEVDFPLKGEKVRFSTNGAVGVSYQLSPKFELYLEPTVNYHFKVQTEHPNYWQQHPVNFSIPLGVRVNW